MKKIFYPLFFLLFLSELSFAQYDCSSNRFRDFNFFSNWDLTSDVEFGANTAVGSSQTQILKMDIYEPQGDNLQKRPLVIMAFGGSFISGQRSDVAYLCKVFAKLGYVSATIDYRVGFFFPDQTTTTLAVVRAMHDMKAAVRYFYKDAQTSNNYRVDTNLIFVGGVSAGAITAIHAAYLDNDSEIPSYLYPDTAGLGGVAGLSGNQGYSSKVAGVVSYSGTIGDTSWINTGDVPIMSIHKTGDQTVPFGTAEVSVSGIPTGLVADGSQSIHIRANHLQIPNRFLIYPGSGHVEYITPGDAHYNEALGFTRDFLADIVCGDMTFEPSNVTLSVNELSDFSNNISIYPNPVNDELNISLTKDFGELNYELMDINGRMVYSKQTNNKYLQIDRNKLPAGMYLLRILDDTNVLHTEKIVLN